MTALSRSTYSSFYLVEQDYFQTNNNSQKKEEKSFLDFLKLSSAKNNNKNSFSLLDETVNSLQDSNSNPFSMGNNKTEISKSSPVTNPISNNSQATVRSGATEEKDSEVFQYAGTSGDGIIGDFQQGNTGDCFFLSGLKAVANDPEGEQILLNSIKKTDSGWNVKFKGAPDQVFHVSQADLDKAKEPEYSDSKKTADIPKLSTGDDDVTILELAAEQYFEKQVDKKTGKQRKFDDGGYSDEAIKLLTGQDSNYTTPIIDPKNSINDAYKNNFENKPGWKQKLAQKMIGIYYENPDKNDAKYALMNEKEKKEFLNQYDDARCWCENNKDMVNAYRAKTDATRMLEKIQKEPDQITMTASRLLNPDEPDSIHAFSVKYDKQSDAFLVTNPHDTSAPPEKYNTYDELLSKYNHLTLTDDIKK